MKQHKQNRPFLSIIHHSSLRLCIRSFVFPASVYFKCISSAVFRIFPFTNSPIKVSTVSYLYLNLIEILFIFLIISSLNPILGVTSRLSPTKIKPKRKASSVFIVAYLLPLSSFTHKAQKLTDKS
jgi:hypothetical protein